MKFLKEHLQNSHYNWETISNHSAFTSDPDRRLFDRLNGNQVLFIINYFGKSLGRLTLSDGQKIEDLIFSQLPQHTKSERSVFNWLRGIYLYYGN